MDKQLSRRRVLQSAGIAGLAGVLAGGTTNKALSKERKRTSGGLEKPDVLVPKVMGKDTISSNVSDDGLALTILFDSLSIARDSTIETTFTTTKATTIEIPLKAYDDKLIGFFIVLRGHIDKDDRTRAAVMLDLGGNVQAIEFPYGKELNEDFQREFFTLIPTVQEKVDDDIVARPFKLWRFMSSFLLSVHRQTQKDEAAITIDSLDIELAFYHHGGRAKRAKE